jgi:hypothetical protein
MNGARTTRRMPRNGLKPKRAMGFEPTTLSLGSYDSPETGENGLRRETPDPAWLQGARHAGPHGR